MPYMHPLDRWGMPVLHPWVGVCPCYTRGYGGCAVYAPRGYGGCAVYAPRGYGRVSRYTRGYGRVSPLHPWVLRCVYGLLPWVLRCVYSLLPVGVRDVPGVYYPGCERCTQCVLPWYHGGYTTPRYMGGLPTLGIPHPASHCHVPLSIIATLARCRTTRPWALLPNIPWVGGLCAS